MPEVGKLGRPRCTQTFQFTGRPPRQVSATGGIQGVFATGGFEGIATDSRRKAFKATLLYAGLQWNASGDGFMGRRRVLGWGWEGTVRHCKSDGRWKTLAVAIMA